MVLQIVYDYQNYIRVDHKVLTYSPTQSLTSSLTYFIRWTGRKSYSYHTTVLFIVKYMLSTNSTVVLEDLTIRFCRTHNVIGVRRLIESNTIKGGLTTIKTKVRHVKGIRSTIKVLDKMLYKNDEKRRNGKRRRDSVEEGLS